MNEALKQATVTRLPASPLATAQAAPPTRAGEVTDLTFSRCMPEDLIWTVPVYSYTPFKEQQPRYQSMFQRSCGRLLAVAALNNVTRIRHKRDGNVRRCL